MRFGNFLFPESRNPEQDSAVIRETLEEAQASDRLGLDAVWLAEHHFDGNCAYVDPVTFAAAVAARTRRVRIGFAVAQVSLHHPVRLAEQISLLDSLSGGRLIVGLGRGTAYNVYEYQGYGIDPAEAHARFLEAEAILVGAWTEPDFRYDGKFWQVHVRGLRPSPLTRPHPILIHASSSERSIPELARLGRPFLMNVQSTETTRRRVALYGAAMRDAGHDEAAIARALEASWMWRNVYVARTDTEAERVGTAAFAAMVEHRSAMRRRVMAVEHEALPGVAAEILPGSVPEGLICGSPASVAAKLSQLATLGIGGVILQFRLGPMPAELARESLELFAREVIPQVCCPALATAN